VSRTWLAVVSLCALDGTLQRTCGNRPGERQIAVDEDDGKVDAIAALELIVTVDRDAAESESEPRRLALEHAQRAGAEPAAHPHEEHDLDAASRRR
jgi:hypothetical protein